MTTASSTADAELELPPGYYLDHDSAAWLTLPWPGDPILPFGHPDRTALLPPSLGPQIIQWCRDNLVHHLTGEPWEFTAGQRRFVHLWYAFDPDSGRWLYRSGVKRGAKGPIAHDTPVMTPNGWVRHGDLRAGDDVYAVDGTPTRVAEVHPEVTEDCYRITFRDGSSIVATGSHRWPVAEFTGAAKRRERIATVAEMVAAGVTYARPLTGGRTKAGKGGVARWRALPSPVIEGNEADFPVPPYVLGYWLGDGDSDGPRLTASSADMAELLGQLDIEGVEHGEPSWTHGDTYRVRFGRGWARASLRAAAVLGAKHIPTRLLRSSPSQRWALLQGLVDSDGTVDKRTGQVEISLSDERLADDVFELAVGLGLMPTRTKGPSSARGIDYGPRHRIKFTPQPGEHVARLPRKLERTRRPRAHSVPFSRSRTITAIDPVATVPARCITVEHEAHVYLVGELNVPTCNTGKDPFGGALVNVELVGPVSLRPDWRGRPPGEWGQPHRLSLVQIAANSEAQAGDLLRVANAMQSKALRRDHGIDAGVTRTVCASGSRAELLTASEKSSEGDPATAILLNESHHMTESNGGHAVAGVARRNVGKSPAYIQARLLELTNAHRQGQESVAEGSFLAWQDQVKRGRVDILYDSREAPPDVELHDEQSLSRGLVAAYSDSPWADLLRLADEARDPRTSVADSIRYYLNGLAAAEDAWVDPMRFDEQARADVVVADRDQIAMFLDCSKSTDATGLVACRISDGYVFTLGGWQRPHGDRGKTWLAPRAEVDAAVREAARRYKVWWFGVDPSPARDDETEALYWADLIDAWHRDLGPDIPVWTLPGPRGHAVKFDMRLSQPGAAERNRLFVEQAEQTAVDIDGEYDDDGYLTVPPVLTHDGHPMLRVHTHNARERLTKWGTTLGKVTRDSGQLVDLAVCMVGARLGRRLVLNSKQWRTQRRATGTGRVIVLD